MQFDLISTPFDRKYDHGEECHAKQRNVIFSSFSEHPLIDNVSLDKGAYLIFRHAQQLMKYIIVMLTEQRR